MFDGPFDSEAQGPFREIAHDHFQCANVNLRFVFRVHGVEVWWCMFTPEHLDDDAEELTDGGHTLYSDARNTEKVPSSFSRLPPHKHKSILNEPSHVHLRQNNSESKSAGSVFSRAQNHPERRKAWRSKKK
jgi:hypothetical protein